MLLKGLRSTKYKAVGLLDDDPALHHSKVCGVPVLGGIDHLPEFVRQHSVKEVLIAIPSATGSQLLRISEYCIEAEVVYWAVPSLPSLLEGRHSITELRELNLDDLLGRDPVRLDSVGVRMRLQDSVVMVTGAAGSIGSELCKQIARYAPRKIVCVDQSETPLFHLQQMLLAETDIPAIFSVTDVGNKARMKQLMQAHQVRIVFHAAAYKHVPMVEANAYDGLRNNVFALMDLLEVAEECGCEDFVLISTDKAVNPSSLMGCTKRLGEMMAASRQEHSMRCVSVRFGNVLGSQGSVIPTFQTQIRNGCAITVTHPQITRYFMTIPEAVSLTLQAFTIGEDGDILVLDMGEPVSIVALAKTLIRISGKTEKEIPIVFTGLRPGEKLYESLFYESELRVRTVLKKVMRAKSKRMNWSILQHDLLKLQFAMRSHDDYQIRCMVKELIPEYEWTPAPVRKMQPVAQFQNHDGESRRIETIPLYPSPRPPLPQLVQHNIPRDLYAPEKTAHGA
jgi:FlaA1/EpsC-like NDP-sugar epimerase